MKPSCASACSGAPDAPEASRISLTLGTAGHIDHGKTSIVQCLTGCWCARLPEELARGMTIDLGFAVWTRSDGRRVGIVDVPGHERFIHNMVAGATGIDVVMLVVAADDGVMPQTVEHVQIVRMLGVRRGLVVINKCDLADEARLAEVEQEVRDCVQGTFLEGSPLVRFSAKTGAGLDALFAALEQTVDGTVERDASGPFLLHVERSFVLQGLGTIISGIPRSGRVKLGDEVELLPDGTRHTVKGVQVYGAAADQGRAGECCALRLSGLSRDQIERGMVAAAPGYFTPSRFLNVKFFYLPHHERPLAPRTAVRFHIGTSDTPGHLVLPERARLAPGSETFAQVQLSRPVVAAPGDFFVLRLLSPVKTLGGGTLIDCAETKLRRGRDNWVETRAEKEKAVNDETHALLLALNAMGAAPCHVDNWARQAGVALEAARAWAADLVARGDVIALPGDRYAAASALEAVTAELLSRLNALHDPHPLYRGFEKKEILRSMPGTRLLVDRAFDALLDEGRLVREAERFFLSEREPKLSPDEQRAAERFTRLYLDAKFVTPRPDELPALTGVKQAAADEILVNLMHGGVLVQLGDQVLLHQDWVAYSKAALETYLRDAPSIRSADFKDLLGTSRKFAIPLLEYWDRMGLTRRVGDERVLREQEKNR
jgi:selenocysteine-specific elongation factor